MNIKMNINKLHLIIDNLISIKESGKPRVCSEDKPRPGIVRKKRKCRGDKCDCVVVDTITIGGKIIYGKQQ